MAVKAIPDDYPQVIPYLGIEGAAKAIDFYTAVFGAKERMRMGGPDDTVGHAELEIGKGMIMLADVGPQSPAPSPKQVGGTPVTVSVYVDDVDAVVERAIEHGAEITSKPDNQFYGDRTAGFTDPFGHAWHVASHIEDVSEEEMGRRIAELFGGGAS
jgi:PhnB protein